MSIHNVFEKDVVYLQKTETRYGTIDRKFQNIFISAAPNKNKTGWRLAVNYYFYYRCGWGAQAETDSIFARIYSFDRKHQNTSTFKEVCRIDYGREINELSKWEKDLKK